MFRVLRVTGVHIMEGGMVQPGVRNPGCTTSGLHGHRKWSGVDESGNSLKPAPGATDNTRVQPQVQPPRFHEQDPPSPSRTESPRARRMRARRARHRAYHWAGAVGAGMALVASAVVTVSVFTLHLGVRPVLTGSMRPDYGPGAVLLTRQVPLAAVHPGMIVLFVPPGDHAEYAHRITSVTGPASAPIITTKGDANEVADPWHARLTTPCSAAPHAPAAPRNTAVPIDTHARSACFIHMHCTEQREGDSNVKTQPHNQEGTRLRQDRRGRALTTSV